MTPQCPAMGKACSTAYKTYGCRCPTCRAWKVARNRDDYLSIKHPRPVKVTPAPHPTKVTPPPIQQISPDKLSKLRELAKLADAAFRRDPSYAADILGAYSANRR